MKRKIAAIIAADVAGYSRLVEEDEEDTLRRFIAASQVFKTLVETHYGRIFNTAGDAILAEFPSSVEAVRCAASIQARISELNAGQPKHRRLLFRIGISVGDVIEHGTDLLGDGVNIAARLQTIATPGGISISHWVQEQIAGKITLPFRDAGFHTVRNIAKPVHVFLASVAEPEAPPPPAKTSNPRPPIAISRGAMIAGGGLVALSVAALIWSRAAKVTPPVTPAPVLVTVPAAPKPATTPQPPESTPAPVVPVAVPQPSAAPAAPVEAAPPKPPEHLPALPAAATPEPAPPAPPAAAATAPSAPAPAPQPAVVPLPVPVAKPAPAPAPAATRPRSAALCAEIRERAQLGDISSDERDLLRTGCR